MGYAAPSAAIAQTPADPTLYGSWSAPADLDPVTVPETGPMQAVHSILLHVGGGRVLCTGIEEDAPRVVLFDPSTLTATRVVDRWPSYPVGEQT